MDTFAYKGISDGKYVEGNIEAINSDEASHKLKEQKIIITNLVRAAKGKKTEEKKGEKKKSSFALFGKKKAKIEDVLIFLIVVDGDILNIGCEILLTFQQE